MRTGILDKKSQKQALGNMSIRTMYQRGSKYSNRMYRIPNPEWIEKMLSLNILVCFKCLEEIKIGDDYTRGGSGGGVTYTKYYHSSCFERMFY